MTIAMKFAVLALLLAVAAAVPLFYRSASWPWQERVAAVVTPGLFILCVWRSGRRIFFADYSIWNEIRLARTFGLYHGVPLYPGKDAIGPIIGTLHTPLSHILYWPATLAPNPVAAIRLGVFLSAVLVFAVLLYNFLGTSSTLPFSGLRRTLRISFTLELLWLAILSSTMLSCIFIIHADPVAIACSTLAAGLLYVAPISPRRLLSAAFFAILAVAAKQTFLTLPVALCLFLLVADGRRVLRTFCLGLLLWGAVVTLAVLTLFHPAKDVVFNLVTLSSNRPPQPIVMALPHPDDGLRLGFHKLCSVIGHSIAPGTEGRNFCCFLLLLSIWVVLLRFVHPFDWQGSLRTLASRHRWLIFATIALVMFPLLFKASITFGGIQNHLAVADYFLALAFTTSFLELRPPSTSERNVTLPHLFAFTLLLFLIHNPALDLRRTRPTSPSPAAQAAAFSLAHPGRAYFVSNPLSSIYSEKAFYSIDHSIEDREIVGFPLTPAQFQAGLPQHEQLIAIDARYQAVGEDSNALSLYLSDGWVPETNPELPNFLVYRRK